MEERKISKIIKDRDKTRSVTGIFGKTGKGKSFLIKNDLIKDLKRVIIIDPMDEYTALEFETLDLLIDHVFTHKVFRVKIVNLMEFDDICALCMELGNITLVIEESQRILPSRSTISEDLKDLIFRGRHKAVSIMLIAQRASTVNIDVRSQWTRIITFNQTEKADIDWFESVSGFDLPEIRSLPIGEYYDITPQSIEKKDIPALKKLIKKS